MKRGIAFQHLVGELEAALDPGATVSVSDWARDDAGGLERDVRVVGTRDGVAFDLFAECKDWTAAPVGPSVVLEVAGKRDFLRADEARVYTNSSFTKKALQVGRDLGVGLYSVVADGDDRARTEMWSLLDRTVVTVQRHWLIIHEVERRVSPDFGFPDVRYEGHVVADFLACRLREVLGRVHDQLRAPPYSGQMRMRALFESPVHVTVCGAPTELRGASLVAELQLHFEQAEVRSRMSLGQFDHLTGKAWVPPGQWIAYEVDESGWTRVPPPNHPPLDPPFLALNFRVNRLTKELRPDEPSWGAVVEAWDAWLVDGEADVECVALEPWPPESQDAGDADNG